MTNFYSRVGAAALAFNMFAAVSAPPACAEPEAPAQQAGEAKAPQAVIDGLDHTLLGVMKDAAKLGYQGRYTALEPIIEGTASETSSLAPVSVIPQAQITPSFGPLGRTGR